MGIEHQGTRQKREAPRKHPSDLHPSHLDIFAVWSDDLCQKIAPKVAGINPFFGGAKSYKNPMVLQEMLLNKYWKVERWNVPCPVVDSSSHFFLGEETLSKYFEITSVLQKFSTFGWKGIHHWSLEVKLLEMLPSKRQINTVK